MRLEVALMLARRAIGTLEDDVRLAKASLNVAPGSQVIGAHVGDVGQLLIRTAQGNASKRTGPNVLAHARVEDGRVGAHGLERVEDRWQLRVVHLDEV